MGEEAADASLLSRVRGHDAFFCRMVDLVPPELYLPKDEEAAAADANAKYYKVRVWGVGLAPPPALSVWWCGVVWGFMILVGG
jgi:hypothetical protein